VRVKVWPRRPRARRTPVPSAGGQAVVAGQSLGMILGAADGGWGVTIRAVIILAVLFAGMVLVAITSGWTLAGFVDFLH
jgi:hypothetical protein